MKRLLLGCVAALALPCGARAQAGCQADARALVDAVASSVERYASADAARLDGFRPISHDFPGMGRHWINLRHAVRDEFDPTRPAILLYAGHDDAPVLVGAAFVALVDAGETVPGPAYLRHAWHEHAGTLDDELFAGDHAAARADDGFAVMVLHVWSVPPLGGGPFDVHNWRLPWLRAGLEPSTTNVDAARALSLLTAVDYYVDALSTTTTTSPQRHRLGALLRDARAQVEDVVDDASAAAPDAARLAAAWRSLVARIADELPQSRDALVRLEADPRVQLDCDAAAAAATSGRASSDARATGGTARGAAARDP